MFTLATYNGKHFPSANRFFILNKGENSGKPSLMPFVNSFTCTCETQDEAEMLYILSYGLWQSEQFKPLLVGSVIEFIRIDDCFDQLLVTYQQAQENPLFVETVSKLMKIDRLIANRREQERQLQRLKTAMVIHHMRPKVAQ